jgi:hypothetical protein
MICTAFSSVTTEREVRMAMAFSSEQSLKCTVIDMACVDFMKEDIAMHKNVAVAINFPYQGASNASTITSINEASNCGLFKEIYISFNRFDASSCNLTKIRTFIKSASSSTNLPINFTIDASWIKNNECLDKICSVLEPYENHSLVLSTYCKKPDKLKEILEFGSHLNSNGSCKYSYFGALPAKKEGIIEILSSGFAYCGVPKQYINLAI